MANQRQFPIVLLVLFLLGSSDCKLDDDGHLISRSNPRPYRSPTRRLNSGQGEPRPVDGRQIFCDDKIYECLNLAGRVEGEICVSFFPSFKDWRITCTSELNIQGIKDLCRKKYVWAAEMRESDKTCNWQFID